MHSITKKMKNIFPLLILIVGACNSSVSSEPLYWSGLQEEQPEDVVRYQSGSLSQGVLF